jgi:hypothetical protein
MHSRRFAGARPALDHQAGPGIAGFRRPREVIMVGTIVENAVEVVENAVEAQIPIRSPSGV